MNSKQTNPSAGTAIHNHQSRHGKRRPKAAVWLPHCVPYGTHCVRRLQLLITYSPAKLLQGFFGYSIAFPLAEKFNAQPMNQAPSPYLLKEHLGQPQLVLHFTYLPSVVVAQLVRSRQTGTHTCVRPDSYLPPCYLCPADEG